MVIIFGFSTFYLSDTLQLSGLTALFVYIVVIKNLGGGVMQVKASDNIEAILKSLNIISESV